MIQNIGEAYFIGERNGDENPYGMIRAITGDGGIFEGQLDQSGNPEGWARYINSAGEC